MSVCIRKGGVMSQNIHGFFIFLADLFQGIQSYMPIQPKQAIKAMIPAWYKTPETGESRDYDPNPKDSQILIFKHSFS